MFQNIKNIYQYREMLKSNVKKDLRGKYKGSFLGFLWTFINPLLQLLVYSIVFSQVLKANVENYPMFLFVALIPWTFFTTAIQCATVEVVNNGAIIKKVYFPREILTLSTVTSAFVNFLLSMIIVVIALIISGIGISKYILLFPLIAIINYVLTLGIGFILSSVTVYLRDLEYIVNVFIMLLFYLTPILYTLDSFPAEYKNILMLNPMATIILAYKDILYYQVMPDMWNLCIVGLLSVIVLFVGYLIFKKLERKFAEEL